MESVKNRTSPFHKLAIDRFDGELYLNYQNLLNRAGWRYLGQGYSRVAYGRKNVVVKVPMHAEGYNSNILESYLYRKYRNYPDTHGRVFAPCRLLSNGCLIMPFIERALDNCERSDLPQWAINIDGQQCGYYNGRLVVYDANADMGQYLFEEALQWAQVT